MRKRVTYEFGGFTGRGKTKTSAVADAHSQALAALSRDYRPEIMRYRGWAILIWASPAGYHSSIVEGKDRSPSREPTNGSCLYPADDTRETVRSAVRIQLAQLGWELADGLTTPDWLSKREAEDFRSWVTWQTDYARLRENGLSDDEARRRLSGY